MRKRMTIAIVATMALGGMMFAISGAAVSADAKSQHVLIKMGSFTNDLHAAFMGIKVGEALEAKGAEVTIFLNLEAVGIADKRQPNDLMWGQAHGAFAEHYDAFVKAGGKVLVCPHCAKAAGLDAANLRPGAALLAEDGLGDLFLGADKVIDY